MGMNKWLSFDESTIKVRTVLGFMRIGDGKGESISKRRTKRIIKAWKKYASTGPTCSLIVGKVSTGIKEKRDITFFPNSISIGCKNLSKDDIKTLLFEIL